MATCSGCKKDLPENAFTPYKIKVNGWCKECSSEYNRNRYKKYSERICAQVRMNRRINHEKVRESDKKSYYKHRKKHIKRQAAYEIQKKKRWPEKYLAHTALNNAIRDGRLKKPMKCPNPQCETPDSRLEAHHDDYLKPLKVQWLCARCHRRQDASVPF